VTQQNPPKTEPWEKLAYECPECGHRLDGIVPEARTSWRTCEECDRRLEFQATVADISQEEALAELVVRSMSSVGVIAKATREREIIRVYIKESGVHLLNFTGNVDIEIHEVGPREAYEEHDDQWPEDAEAFCNGYVRGLRDEWTGHAFPTHTTGKDGAFLREDVDEDLQRLGELGGIIN